MKKTITILSILFSTLLATAAIPEPPREFVVGLSPFQSVLDRSNQMQTLQRFFLKEAPNNCRIVVWDAWQLRVVCDIRLPKLAYDSPSARAPHVVADLTNLKQWYTKVGAEQIPIG